MFFKPTHDCSRGEYLRAEMFTSILVVFGGNDLDDMYTTVYVQKQQSRVIREGYYIPKIDLKCQ